MKVVREDVMKIKLQKQGTVTKNKIPHIVQPEKAPAIKDFIFLPLLTPLKSGLHILVLLRRKRAAETRIWNPVFGVVFIAVCGAHINQAVFPN